MENIPVSTPSKSMQQGFVHHSVSHTGSQCLATEIGFHLHRFCGKRPNFILARYRAEL